MNEKEAWQNVLDSMKVACEISGCKGCELTYGNGTCPIWPISRKIDPKPENDPCNINIINLDT